MIDKSKFYLSTMADVIFEEDGDGQYRERRTMDSANLAKEFGLGLEFAEFCTAYNMDERFTETDMDVRAKMACADRYILHAPFNELCPAAIDPLAAALTKQRYMQATRLAYAYGIRKIVIHSGYVPNVYYKSWFHDRSVEFWRAYLSELPEGMTVCLENVMEDEPALLSGIAQAVNDPRLRLCLDVGHANLDFSRVPLSDWLDCCAPYLSHLHLHNNLSAHDLHSAIYDGRIDMAELLEHCEKLCPDATYTIETMRITESVEWLTKSGFLKM